MEYLPMPIEKTRGFGGSLWGGLELKLGWGGKAPLPVRGVAFRRPFLWVFVPMRFDCDIQRFTVEDLLILLPCYQIRYCFP